MNKCTTEVNGYTNTENASFVTSLHPEDGGSMVLRNVGILSQHNMESQPRRPQLEADYFYLRCIIINSFPAGTKWGAS
jgi:hypothetical protein